MSEELGMFPTIDRIIERTCSDAGVTTDFVRSDNASQRAYWIKALIAVRARNRKYTYEEIGRALGGRHYSTVINLCGELKGKRKDG